jgi:colanic acid biosynthesis glycosyl transferase WcaI
VTKPCSLTARLIRLANTILFRSLDAIITIGRDVEPLLLAYKGVSPKKMYFIPNCTLLPSVYRELTPDNRFRAGRQSQLIVGLSGNLGFTHSPHTVFEAARLLKEREDIRLILRESDGSSSVIWRQQTNSIM